MSRLISYEQQTQVTPFPVLTLYLQLRRSLPPPFSLFLSLPPSLYTSPSLTSLANCEAVVQHARQPASQCVGLSPIIHNHNRQKGYMQTTDRIALKLRAEESGRQSHWQRVGEQAKKERGAVREREIEGIVLHYEALSRIP